MVERIGYSIRGIRFNIILFAICLLISSILFIACIMTVKKEEEQKAEEKAIGNIKIIYKKSRTTK